MQKLKLLFITCDFRKNVTPSSHHFAEALGQVTDLYTWYEPGHIEEILSQIPFVPDFVLLNDLKEEFSPPIEGLHSLRIPFGILMHDLHWRPWKRRAFIEENQVKHIFSHYRDKFLEWYPEYAERMRWLPHFAHTIFRDYGEKKSIDWLLMGAVDDFYPLRQAMLRVMHDKPGFVCHPHPGYRDIEDDERQNILVGEDYAKEINRAKMFLTCDSIFHYPLLKYYEVLACKTLLLASASSELKDLGFIPGEHFVGVDEDDFLEKAEYYLHHEEERNHIAEQGYQLVHSRHTSLIRARQLVEMIHEILEQISV